MTINYNEMEAVAVPHFLGGEGEMAMKKYEDEDVKLMKNCLVPGTSIGKHTHGANREIIYVLEGALTVEMEGNTEVIPAGCAHYCPKGHTHEIFNRGDVDAVFFAVVAAY